MLLGPQVPALPPPSQGPSPWPPLPSLDVPEVHGPAEGADGQLPGEVGAVGKGRASVRGRPPLRHRTDGPSKPGLKASTGKGFIAVSGPTNSLHLPRCTVVGGRTSSAAHPALPWRGVVRTGALGRTEVPEPSLDRGRGRRGKAQEGSSTRQGDMNPAEGNRAPATGAKLLIWGPEEGRQAPFFPCTAEANGQRLLHSWGQLPPRAGGGEVPSSPGSAGSVTLRPSGLPAPPAGPAQART